jgi:hypothetical protein
MPNGIPLVALLAVSTTPSTSSRTAWRSHRGDPVHGPGESAVVPGAPCKPVRGEVGNPGDQSVCLPYLIHAASRSTSWRRIRRAPSTHRSFHGPVPVISNGCPVHFRARPRSPRTLPLRRPRCRTGTTASALWATKPSLLSDDVKSPSRTKASPWRTAISTWWTKGPSMARVGSLSGEQWRCVGSFARPTYSPIVDTRSPKPSPIGLVEAIGQGGQVERVDRPEPL